MVSSDVEVERIWTEAAVAYFEMQYRNWHRGTEVSRERSQDSRSPDRDMNPQSPVLEAAKFSATVRNGFLFIRGKFKIYIVALTVAVSTAVEGRKI
jgi:hypothetical protein